MWASVLRPCSSQADGQVWEECICWQEFDGAWEQMEVTFLSILSLLWGEKHKVKGAVLQEEGAEQDVWVPASCYLSMNSDNGIWLREHGSQGCTYGGGEVTDGKWGKPSLQVRNKLWGPSLPWVYSPKEGCFPPFAVSQTQLYPNCDAWRFLCFCF